MPALFSVLTFVFGVVAYAGARHGQWIIAVAAAVIGVWMGSFALGALRRMRR